MAAESQPTLCDAPPRSQEHAAAGEDGRGMAASCSFICLHSFSSLPLASRASILRQAPHMDITHPLGLLPRCELTCGRGVSSACPSTNSKACSPNLYLRLWLREEAAVYAALNALFIHPLLRDRRDPRASSPAGQLLLEKYVDLSSRESACGLCSGLLNSGDAAAHSNYLSFYGTTPCCHIRLVARDFGYNRKKIEMHKKTKDSYTNEASTRTTYCLQCTLCFLIAVNRSLGIVYSCLLIFLYHTPENIKSPGYYKSLGV